MANLVKFISLSNLERLLLFQAFFMLISTSVSLKIFGLKLHPLNSNQGNNIHPSSSYPKDSALALSTARMVRIATRYCPFSASCLSRSLVLLKLLKKRGIVAQLRIGVQKVPGRVKAHAWVEHQGEIINDTEDVRSRYIPFNNPVSI